MNTVERIVEAYFRLCQSCFTYSDVKVVKGNNRQFDLLAISLLKDEHYHIECSVTHMEKWCPTPETLFAAFQKKFTGIPPSRVGRNTDVARRKRYGEPISTMYLRLGLKLEKIRRIWVCWAVNDPESELNAMLQAYRGRTGYLVQVVSLRDEILPALMANVGTANYDDDVLRMFSLVKQSEVQRERHRKKGTLPGSSP